MSRTYRDLRNRWHSRDTVEGEIAWTIDWANRFPFTSKRVRKSDEDYEKQVAAAKRKYHEAIAKNGGSDEYVYTAGTFDFMTNKYVSRQFVGKIRMDYVSKYEYIRVKRDVDAEIEKAKIDFAKRARDGYCNDTGRNTGFKKAAAKSVRQANKNFCKKVLADDEWEDDPYPTHKLGKALVWNFW